MNAIAELLGVLIALFLRFFPGWKAALVAIGQIGLGVYLISDGRVQEGVALIVLNLGVLLESMRN